MLTKCKKIATHRIRNKIIYKPRNADCRQTFPISLEDELIRDLRVLHGIPLEPSGLLHVETPGEDGNGWDHTEAEGQAPDGTEVVFAKASFIETGNFEQMAKSESIRPRTSRPKPMERMQRRRSRCRSWSLYVHTLTHQTSI